MVVGDFHFGRLSVIPTEKGQGLERAKSMIERMFQEIDQFDKKPDGWFETSMPLPM